MAVRRHFGLLAGRPAAHLPAAWRSDDIRVRLDAVTLNAARGNIRVILNDRRKALAGAFRADDRTLAGQSADSDAHEEGGVPPFVSESLRLGIACSKAPQ